MDESTTISVLNFNKIISKLNFETALKKYLTTKKGHIEAIEASKVLSVPRNLKRIQKDFIFPNNQNQIFSRKLNINKNIDFTSKEDNKFLRKNKLKNRKYLTCQRLSSASNRLAKQNSKILKNISNNFNCSNNGEILKNRELMEQIIVQNNEMVLNNLKKLYKKPIFDDLDKITNRPNSKMILFEKTNNNLNNTNTLPLILSIDKEKLVMNNHNNNKESKNEIYINQSKLQKNKEINKNSIQDNLTNRFRNVYKAGITKFKTNNHKTNNLNITSINKFTNKHKNLVP